MAAIFSNVRLDRRQFRHLVTARGAGLVARRETAPAIVTAVRNQIHDGVHTFGRHHRPRMPGMSRLSTGLSSTCDAPTAFTLSAGEAVRRWRLGRGRRILLSQRELPFEIGDPLLLLRILLSESFVFT
ncbi:MAG TPA: hypothetical protein VMS04_20830, partial [Vicinamibacterales bacterium]|nr:hypothetical protein [Vicinamibacterales bacterium]